MFVFKAGVVGAGRMGAEMIKRLSSGPDLQAGIEAEKASSARVFASQDAREGTAAFVQKRSPRFHGS